MLDKLLGWLLGWLLSRPLNELVCPRWVKALGQRHMAGPYQTHLRGKVAIYGWSSGQKPSLFDWIQLLIDRRSNRNLLIPGSRRKRRPREILPCAADAQHSQSTRMLAL